MRDQRRTLEFVSIAHFRNTWEDHKRIRQERTGLVLSQSSVGVCLAGKRLLVAVGGGRARLDRAGITRGV